MKKIVFTLLTFAFSLPAFAQYWKTPLQDTNLPASRGIQTISVIDSNVVWADTYDGSGGQAVVHDFIRTVDGGTTWVAGDITVIPAGWAFSHFAAFTDSMAWAVCYNNTAGNGSNVYRTLDAGTTWVSKNPFSTTASFADAIHFFSNTEGVVIGDPLGGYFEIYRTTDTGNTWTRVPQANLPAPLSGEYGLTRSIGSSGDNVWFGTNKSRIYKSTDRGITWTVSNIQPLVGAGTLVTDFAMENAMTGMCFAQGTDTINRIIKTTDGGATWTQVLSNTQNAGFIRRRNNLANVPGSSRYFVTGADFNTGDHGSVYTDDYGATWVTVDSAVQHLGTGWADLRHGWSGSFSDPNGLGIGGMFKWGDTTEYIITTSSNPVAGSTTTGDGTFSLADNVTVSSTPNAGYTFVYWAEAGIPVSTNANYSFQVLRSRNLVANLVPDTTHYQVVVSANPAVGGAAMGGGSYLAAATVTVTATANTGYAFTNWTENGNVVSTSATYSFPIIANRNLVANFVAVNYSVVLSALPTAGGTVSGAGSYQEGSSVTVTATPNTNYIFVNWTESGTIVSTNPAYTFTITGNRTLVANFQLFIGIAPSALATKLAVFPNPSQGLTHINSLTDLELNVYNSLGQKVLSQSITEGDNSINLADNGMYMFVFSKEGEQPYTVKVINNK